jgi:hypothetical protein
MTRNKTTFGVAHLSCIGGARKGVQTSYRGPDACKGEDGSDWDVVGSRPKFGGPCVCCGSRIANDRTWSAALVRAS